MLFSSLTFIFYFLPLCIIFYYIIPSKFIKIKNFILLIFSVLFYAWGEPRFIFLMFATVLISYIGAFFIKFFDNKQKLKHKRIVFIFTIIALIGSLFYFKYFNFFLSNIAHIFRLNISIKKIVLPIGISFYTFQILTYLIDLYRNKIALQTNFINLSLYIAFFPQLIAGPIVTYQSIEKQINCRETNFSKITDGIKRFIVGLSKKVLIANQMALLADSVYNFEFFNELSFGVFILGTFAYTLQIYFDFSGYSDMAIGLGKIFGFEFSENFNYPYISTSIGDFWKRWHISLTTFFREYLYIPLGGNRVKKLRWIINMLIVWLLTGLWHGAEWNFILWGLYYLILLLLERTIFKNVVNKMPFIIKYLLTFFLINIGWIIFRVNNITDLFSILSFKGNYTLNIFINNNSNLIIPIILLPLGYILSLNVIQKIRQKHQNSFVYLIIENILLIIFLLICIAFLASSSYNPFIYFRF